ncbi:MAG: metallophosphoesterase [Planctomycetes bacterium]|nr:metallophosphoesterase [Planctomycetota bacterium]
MLHPGEFAAVLVFVSVVALVYLSAGTILVGMALARWRPERFKPTGWRARRPVRITVLSLAGLGTLCIAYGWLIEPYWIETTRLEVRTDDWPEGTRLRLVLISDLHLDGEGPRERALPGLLEAAQPDAIVIAGDFLNTLDAAEALRRLAGRFHAPKGVYGVMGNW